MDDETRRVFADRVAERYADLDEAAPQPTDELDDDARMWWLALAGTILGLLVAAAVAAIVHIATSPILPGSDQPATPASTVAPHPPAGPVRLTPDPPAVAEGLG